MRSISSNVRELFQTFLWFQVENKQQKRDLTALDGGVRPAEPGQCVDSGMMDGLVDPAHLFLYAYYFFQL